MSERIINRTNNLGISYVLASNSDGGTIIRTGMKSLTVGVPLDVLSQAWFNWQMKGESIQNAFYMLNADVREFIKTGITPEEWDAIFSQPEA